MAVRCNRFLWRTGFKSVLQGADLKPALQQAVPAKLTAIIVSHIRKRAAQAPFQPKCYIMKLPLTTGQFLEVFRIYNEAVFPMQILFYLLALALVFLAIRRKEWSDKAIVSVWAGPWLWMGVVYHLLFFSPINPAAYVFGALYVVQAVLFLVAGLQKNRLVFSYTPTLKGITGAVFIFYALLLYPVAGGYFLGHAYPASPTFGLPCPTTIFTFGMLL